MTPDELFDKAIGNRRTMLELTRLDAAKAGPFDGDVPLLSLTADQRAHRRTDAKLDDHPLQDGGLWLRYR